MHRQIKAGDNDSYAIRQTVQPEPHHGKAHHISRANPRELTTCQHHAIHYPAETSPDYGKARTALSAMVLAVFHN